MIRLKDSASSGAARTGYWRVHICLRGRGVSTCFPGRATGQIALVNIDLWGGRKTYTDLQAHMHTCLAGKQIWRFTHFFSVNYQFRREIREASNNEFVRPHHNAMLLDQFIDPVFMDLVRFLVCTSTRFSLKSILSDEIPSQLGGYVTVWIPVEDIIFKQLNPLTWWYLRKKTIQMYLFLFLSWIARMRPVQLVTEGMVLTFRHTQAQQERICYTDFCLYTVTHDQSGCHPSCEFTIHYRLPKIYCSSVIPQPIVRLANYTISNTSQ